eukprot:4096414-Prymnesium_polylepis.1
MVCPRRQSERSEPTPTTPTRSGAPATAESTGDPTLRPAPPRASMREDHPPSPPCAASFAEEDGGARTERSPSQPPRRAGAPSEAGSGGKENDDGGASPQLQEDLVPLTWRESDALVKALFVPADDGVMNYHFTRPPDHREGAAATSKSWPLLHEVLSRLFGAEPPAPRSFYQRQIQGLAIGRSDTTINNQARQ